MGIFQSALRPSQSSSTRASSPELSDEHEFQDPLLELASELEQEEFTTYRKAVRSLRSRQKALELDQTRNEFLVFSSVTEAQFSRLSDDASPTYKFCRFSFNAKMGILIVKVKAYNAHEIAITAFLRPMILELEHMEIDNEMDLLGSPAVHLGNWQREADLSWGGPRPPPKLSLVLQVGSSESARRLCLDARSWLETPSSSVKFVFTIEIDHSNPEIILRCWELVPQRAGMLMQSSTFSAGCTAVFKFSRTNNTIYMIGESNMNETPTPTTQLVLPFEKIVGRPPYQPREGDLVISDQQLKLFAEKVWRWQNLKCEDNSYKRSPSDGSDVVL